MSQNIENKKKSLNLEIESHSQKAVFQRSIAIAIMAHDFTVFEWHLLINCHIMFASSTDTVGLQGLDTVLDCY